MDYVACIKLIVQHIYACDTEVKEKIGKLMKRRSIEDLGVLKTMLERCSESTNQQLQLDLDRHGIPKRLEKLEKIISSTHYHTWNAEASEQGSFTFFRCIQHEKNWNHSLAGKAGIVAAGAVGGIFLFGVPLVITANIVRQINNHASDVEKELSWVVDEIEKLYDQISALILANLV